MKSVKEVQRRLSGTALTGTVTAAACLGMVMVHGTGETTLALFLTACAVAIPVFVIGNRVPDDDRTPASEEDRMKLSMGLR